MARLYYPQARAILQVVFDGFGDSAQDTPPKIIPVLPRAVTVQRNSYKQADSWELTFEANDLPIDPQLVRAGSVEIFLLNLSAQDETRTVLGRLFTVLDEPGRPRDAVDEIALELGVQASAKDRFTFGRSPTIAGLFDGHSMELSSSGKWVTIQGQDYTAFLIGRKWPPTQRGTARRIPTGQRLDQLLARLLAEADPEGRLRIDPRHIDAARLPIVGAGEVRSHRRGIPIAEETSYWDVLYKLATRYGFILFVDGLDVVLTQPKNFRDAYEPGVKRLQWGHNIESLHLDRSLGKEKVPRIVVKAYDDKTKKLITVEFPERQQAGPAGTLGVNEDEFQIVPIYGITDRAALRRAAENLFNLLGKSERRVQLATRDLKDTRDQDLTDLKAGDAVTVEFDDFNREVLANPNIPRQAKVEHLVARGYGEAIAQTLAEHYDRLQFLARPLRIREVTYEWDVDQGLSIEMELVDFVVVDGMRAAENKATRRGTRQDRFRRRPGIGNDSEPAEIRFREHLEH